MKTTNQTRIEDRIQDAISDASHLFKARTQESCTDAVMSMFAAVTKASRLESEDCIWVEHQAPAGNWVRATGHPCSNEGGRAAAINAALAEVKWWTKNGTGAAARVVEAFHVVLV